MQKLNREGRLVKFSSRSDGKRSEIRDWKTYSRRGEHFERELGNKIPDIVNILNEEAREEREKKRASIVAPDESLASLVNTKSPNQSEQSR